MTWSHVRTADGTSAVLKLAPPGELEAAAPLAVAELLTRGR
jgi:hypothetical protein